MRRSRRSRDAVSVSDLETGNGPPKVLYPDEFSSLCDVLRGAIERAMSDPEQRTAFLDTLSSFYVLIQQLIREINSKSSSQNLDSLFQEICKQWQPFRLDISSSLINPYRISFINYCHTELCKIADGILHLLYHPPVTPQYADQMPKLSYSIAVQFIEIMDRYRQLFESLLGHDAIDHSLIDEARTPLRIIRSELTKKYKVFFLVDSKDKATEVLERIQRYIDRILKKTEHLSTAHESSTGLILPLKRIDAALDRIGKRIGRESEISSVYTAFSEVASSYSHFARLSDAMSSATGLTHYLDSASTISALSRNSRVRSPWFSPPFFKDYCHIRNRLHEYSAILEARYRDTLDIAEAKDGGIIDAYGERDVLEQQIATDEERVQAASERVNTRKIQLEALTKTLNRIERSSSKIQNSRSLFDEILGGLDTEKEQLTLADTHQKSLGSRVVDEELARLQKILEDHEKLLKEMAQDRATLRELEGTETAKQQQIGDLQADTDKLAHQIEDLLGVIEGRKGHIMRNNRKIEQVNMEIEKLKWEVENIAASEERHRQKIELKIADVEDETAELEAIRAKSAAELDALKERHRALEEDIIPELQYQIEKRSVEHRFQVIQSARWKDSMETLVLGAIASQLDDALTNPHPQ
jgi:archaellum component FlaC